MVKGQVSTPIRGQLVREKDGQEAPEKVILSPEG